MIKVLKKGLYTSIQDLGRTGYRKYGVPVSGAMDLASAKLANSVLGNDSGEAVMEITLQGPELEFTAVTSISITGADLSPALNGEAVEHCSVIEVQENDVLTFGRRTYGARSYLAVAGGFQTEQSLNSRSYFQGIMEKAMIQSGDELTIGVRSNDLPVTGGSIDRNTTHIHQTELQVNKGPEYELLNATQQAALTAQTFTIRMNNRMGYQLEQPIENQLASILSSAVLPGTVQLTPSGKLIVLMRDCQTTGGYPRVLQLTNDSIDTLSQKVSKDQIKFVFSH